MKPVATSLGYAGLAPFAASAVGVWLLQDYPRALSQQGFIVYSLAILCFLAGSLWATAMQRSGPDRLLRLLVSNGIVIFAVLSVLTAQAVIAAVLLALAYLAMLWYERGSTAQRGWYSRMRVQLTVLVVALHIAYIAGLVMRGSA
ncbi:MAG: DUF3429 domain-containing protein [Haliea sp.]|mgnify:CR=1 FL=1|jgi:hypothetical protein|nr:DUF3429 domain-containing protein [Haliea sp.]MDP5064027.1 DUF3429 domain-containing protein [Haliea sp.]